ncbi:MAG: STAS domain-containing protein [Bacteroidota bacterium]|nr:STAS domain-containing protein [Bacteroidota bacterium]
MFSTQLQNDVAVFIVNLKSASKDESDAFKHLLQENIDKGFIKLVIDLSKCNKIDSTFLSSMVLALQQVNSKSGRINLVVAKSEVQSLIDKTGMNELFLIFANRKAAIQNLTE